MAPRKGSEKFARKSERELFLDRMQQVAPWGELLALAEPYEPPAEDLQPGIGLPILLRTYLAQQWFDLSDSGAEDALYESPVLRRFAGVDLSLAAAPEETAIRHFRQWLDDRDLGSRVMAAVNRYLDERGIRITRGQNPDAMILDAPPAAANSAGQDDFQFDQALEDDQDFPAPTDSAGVYSGAYSMDRETVEFEARDRSSGPTRSRVMVKAHSPSPGASGLSVAVISPHRKRREAATSALSECHNGPIREFVSYPPNLEDVSRTLNRDFDIVIIDMDGDPEYALNLVKSISTNGLATVMVYSARIDPEMLLRAMRAGAREFLTLPFGSGVMADALLRAQAFRSAAHPAHKVDGKVLVFLSAKGGSGVTTLACNFAVSLAQESGKRTLLIDLSFPLGGVAINLGIRAEHSIANALQHFKRLDASFLSSLLEEHASGLFVLAAPNYLAPTEVDDDAIAKLLEVAREEFDYVVVDAGAKLGLQHSHLFDKSAIIYLVTQVGLAELRNSNRLISKLSAAASPKLEIVVNRYDPRNPEIADEQVAEALTRPPEWRIPNNYAAVRRMQNTATPLMGDDSEISRAIRQMTRAVSGEAAAPQKKKGFSFFR
ncbi:MAG: transposase [Terriglobales bacterium]